MKEPVVLRVYKDGELKTVKQFDKVQISIGRNSTTELCLDEDGVSPLHAVIELREERYFISDLGSESGILKDDKKVLDEALNSGDQLVIGPFTVEFFIGVPKTQSGPPKVPVSGAEKSGVKKSDTKLKNVDVSAPVISLHKKIESSQKVNDNKIKEPNYAAQEVKTKWSKKVKNKKTFAPESEISDLSKVIKPSKGTIVEVVVAWKERVISSHHFKEKGAVTIGSKTNSDINIPLMGGGNSQHTLLNIAGLASVSMSPDMEGFHFSEDGRKSRLSERVGMLQQGQQGVSFELAQGEMVCIQLPGDQIYIYIRYVPDVPKPIGAPLLDLTASEVTGVILAVVVAAIFGLYMMIYSPVPLEEEQKIEERIRPAKIIFKSPVKEKVKAGPKREKKIVKVKKKPKKKTVKQASIKKSGKAGRLGGLKKKKKKTKVKQVSTSRRKGGSKKISKKAGSNYKSKKPDPTKSGLLATFGGRGLRERLDDATSGKGGVFGTVDENTGKSGQNENRGGQGLGSKFKQGSGAGKSSVGISGVGTKGLGGGGAPGLGQGGLGEKGSVSINLTGDEADFTGSIDRDAIRRVIRNHRSQIRNCYNKALNKDPDLFGKITLQWDIEERGVATNVKTIKNTMPRGKLSQQVASCLMRRLRGWKFPEPPLDQVGRVTYPFFFKSQ